MPDTLRGCKLTIAGQVDASSVPSIVRDVVASLPAGATVEQKVLALYRYVRAHVFAYLGTMDDMIEPLNKAVYTLNWWGYGLCGRQAKTLAMLAAELLGPQDVRLVGMGERERDAWRVGQEGRPYAFTWTMFSSERTPDQLYGHSSLEIRWDGRWHFLDVMVGFYRRDEAGRIVSIQEILDRPELADRPVGDPDGDMPYGPEPEIFTRSTVKFYKPGLNAWPGELPRLNLRPGESFTFLPAPLPGQFVIHPQMRARFRPEAIEGGPREGRRNAPPATYGNGEHVYRVRLTADDGCPHWCRQSADWHVPVTLPYPITSIHWSMTAGGKECGMGNAECGMKNAECGIPNSEIRVPNSEFRGPNSEIRVPNSDCSGFLLFPPSTGDELRAIESAGSHQVGPAEPPGTSYRLIVRAPDRQGPVDLTLRTIVQLNRRVVPKLRPGRNVVRLAADGPGTLTAELNCRQAGRARQVTLSGAGEHVVELADAGEPSAQSIRLTNPAI